MLSRNVRSPCSTTPSSELARLLSPPPSAPGSFAATWSSPVATSENEERSIEGKPSSSADSAERGQWLYVRWLQE